MPRTTAWLALCLTVALAACGDGDGSGDAGNVRVVASFYPLAEAAARVGGDRVAVTNLTPPGAEPHDLEPTSKDIDRIEGAAVVLYLGGGFQPGIEEAAPRSRGEAVEVLSADLGQRGADPHVWLDPSLMIRIAEKVQAALIQADPAGTATYEANAAVYTAALAMLDADFRQGLAACDRKTIVTSHDAFGYLARRYGLTQDALAGLDPEAEPDPRRLSELAAKVRAEGITTIFYETLVSPKVAQTLARETGVKTAVLNPIEGLDEDEQAAGQDYASVMRANLTALRTALGCR